MTHPLADPGDGREECPTCGKWVFLVLHSCTGVRVSRVAPFTCPQCGMTSYNQNDMAEKYCGNCHDWTG